MNTAPCGMFSRTSSSDGILPGAKTAARLRRRNSRIEHRKRLRQQGLPGAKLIGRLSGFTAFSESGSNTGCDEATGHGFGSSLCIPCTGAVSLRFCRGNRLTKFHRRATKNQLIYRFTTTDRKIEIWRTGSSAALDSPLGRGAPAGGVKRPLPVTA